MARNKKLQFGICFWAIIFTMSGHWIPLGVLDFKKRSWRFAAVCYEIFWNFYHTVQILVTITLLFMDVRLHQESFSVFKHVAIVQSNQNLVLSLASATIFQFQRQRIANLLNSIKYFSQLPSIRYLQNSVERKISRILLLTTGIPILLTIMNAVLDVVTAVYFYEDQQHLELNNTVAQEITKSSLLLDYVPRVGYLFSALQNASQDAFAIGLICFVYEELKGLSRELVKPIFSTKQAFTKSTRPLQMHAELRSCVNKFGILIRYLNSKIIINSP
jgi:hypothetical protein